MATFGLYVPVLVVFKEITQDDVNKQQGKSNSAPDEGGGGRDIRFGDPDRFFQILSPMFPNQGSKPGSLSGVVCWVEGDKVASVTLQLLPKYGSEKRREARISPTRLVKAWDVDVTAYAADKAAGIKWFYVLVLDTENTVWVRVIKQSDLNGEHPIVARYINSRITATKGNAAVRGSMNFRQRENYP